MHSREGKRNPIWLWIQHCSHQIILLILTQMLFNTKNPLCKRTLTDNNLAQQGKIAKFSPMQSCKPEKITFSQKMLFRNDGVQDDNILDSASEWRPQILTLRFSYDSDKVQPACSGGGVFSGQWDIKPRKLSSLTKILFCICYGLPTEQNWNKIWNKIAILGLCLISRMCSIERSFYGGKMNPPKLHGSHLHCVISLSKMLAFQRDRICSWNFQLPEHAWPPSSGKSPGCISRGSSFLGQH